MLDIAPKLEHEIVERAEANGMTAEQYLEKLLSTDRAKIGVGQHKTQVAAPVETPAETAQCVQSLLARWQAETGMPASYSDSKTLAQLSAEWAAEDANRTDAEIAAERAVWAEYEQAILNSPGVSI